MKNSLNTDQQIQPRHTATWYKENFGVNPLKLGLPFEEVRNPHFRSAAPMRLWKEEDVLPYKTDKGIQQHQKRSATTTKAAQVRREKLIAEVETWEIKLEREEYWKIVKAAIKSYNYFHEDVATERGWDFEPASTNSDPAFLRRITQNYLRHNLSNYEAKLKRIFGKVGTADAYIIIREKIDAKIIAVYPELKGRICWEILKLCWYQ